MWDISLHLLLVVVHDVVGRRAAVGIIRAHAGKHSRSRSRPGGMSFNHTRARAPRCTPISCGIAIFFRLQRPSCRRARWEILLEGAPRRRQASARFYQLSHHMCRHCTTCLPPTSIDCDNN